MNEDYIREIAYEIWQRRKDAKEPNADNAEENWARAIEFTELMDRAHRG
jgi:hypothetical protein